MTTHKTEPTIDNSGIEVCLLVDRPCHWVNSMGPDYEKVHGACQLGFLEDLGRVCGLVEATVQVTPSS